MTTSDWINLIAAILVAGGTLFLGIMAWRTIRQTRNIQKAEKRERLLLENQLLNYQELYIISKYIEKIAEKFGAHLDFDVSRIATPLANIRGAIQEYLENPQDEHVHVRLEGYEEQLLKRARTLIEKAAEIKTK